MSGSSTRLSTPIGTPKPTTNGPITHPAYKLLSRAHSDDPETATKIFTEKVVHKPLLLSQSADHLDKRAARRHIRLHKKAYAIKHARPRPLSAKEKRKLKLYELRPQDCRYEVYQGLNQLWQRYILEVLGYVDREGNVVQSRVGAPATVSSAGNLIASADFHGMEVEVVKCSDPGRVGLKGIVVRETRSTLTIVCNEKEGSARKLAAIKKRRETGECEGSAETTKTPAQHLDKVRMILKKGVVFRVSVDLPTASSKQGKVPEEEEGQSHRQLVFELHGSMLETRPPERASKKFKFQWKALDYL